jgi:hypothetical protein
MFPRSGGFIVLGGRYAQTGAPPDTEESTAAYYQTAASASGVQSTNELLNYNHTDNSKTDVFLTARQSKNQQQKTMGIM